MSENTRSGEAGGNVSDEPISILDAVAGAGIVFGVVVWLIILL